MCSSEHLLPFGSITALHDFDVAVSAEVAAYGSNQKVPSPTQISSAVSQGHNQLDYFTSLEKKALLLGVALFGERWADVAQVVGTREVDEVASFLARQQLSNSQLPFARSLCLSAERRHELSRCVRAAALKLVQDNCTGDDLIMEAIEGHDNGLLTDGQLVKRLIAKFGRDLLLATVDLSALKEEPSPKPSPSIQQHIPCQPSPDLPRFHDPGEVAPLTGLLAAVHQTHRAPTSTPPSSRGGRKRPATPQRYSSDYGEGYVKVCANCGTSNTPLWRKEGNSHMCNACGIYFKNHGYHRPVDLVKASGQRQGSHAGSGIGRQGTPGHSSDMRGAGHEHREDTATSPLARNNTRFRKSPLHYEFASARPSTSQGGYGSEGGARRSPGEGTAPSTAEGPAMLGGDGQQDLAGAFPNPSRRSERRRTTKHLGDDWCEPDEIVLRQGQQAMLRRRANHDSEGEFVDEVDTSGLHQYMGLPGTPPHAAPESQYMPSKRASYGSGPARVSAIPGHVVAEVVGSGRRRSFGSAGVSPYDAQDATPTQPAAAAVAGGSESSDVTDLHVTDDVSQVANALLQLRRGIGGWDPGWGADHLAGDHPRLMGSRATSPSPMQADDAAWGEEGEQDMDEEDEGEEGLRAEASEEPGMKDEPWTEEGHRPQRKRGRAGARNFAGPVTRRPSPESRHGGGSTICANCGTSKTPLWRKDRETGATMCNACGIYRQTHGYDRHVDAQGDTPQRAQRRTPTPSAAPVRQSTRTSSHGGSPVLEGTGAAASTTIAGLPPLSNSSMAAGGLSWRPPLPPARASAPPVSEALAESPADGAGAVKQEVQQLHPDLPPRVPQRRQLQQVVAQQGGHDVSAPKDCGSPAEPAPPTEWQTCAPVQQQQQVNAVGQQLPQVSAVGQQQQQQVSAAGQQEQQAGVMQHLHAAPGVVQLPVGQQQEPRHVILLRQLQQVMAYHAAQQGQSSSRLPTAGQQQVSQVQEHAAIQSPSSHGQARQDPAVPEDAVVLVSAPRQLGEAGLKPLQLPGNEGQYAAAIAAQLLQQPQGAQLPAQPVIIIMPGGAPMQLLPQGHPGLEAVQAAAALSSEQRPAPAPLQ